MLYLCKEKVLPRFKTQKSVPSTLKRQSLWYVRCHFLDSEIICKTGKHKVVDTSLDLYTGHRQGKIIVLSHHILLK